MNIWEYKVSIDVNIANLCVCDNLAGVIIFWWGKILSVFLIKIARYSRNLSDAHHLSQTVSQCLIVLFDNVSCKWFVCSETFYLLCRFEVSHVDRLLVWSKTVLQSKNSGDVIGKCRDFKVLNFFPRYYSLFMGPMTSMFWTSDGMCYLSIYLPLIMSHQYWWWDMIGRKEK